MKPSEMQVGRWYQSDPQGNGNWTRAYKVLRVVDRRAYISFEVGQEGWWIQHDPRVCGIPGCTSDVTRWRECCQHGRGLDEYCDPCGRRASEAELTACSFWLNMPEREFNKIGQLLRAANITTAEQLRKVLPLANEALQMASVMLTHNITELKQLDDALSERDALRVELTHEKQRAELHAARVKELEGYNRATESTAKRFEARVKKLEGIIIDESVCKVQRDADERFFRSPDTSDCLNSQLPSTLAKRNLPAPKKVVIRCEGDWEP